MSVQELEKIASQVRRDIVRMVHAQSSGHPGGSLGCTEYMVSLYFEILNKDTDFKMDGKNEDVFFLSNGHISPVFYSVLARSGYFPIKELNTFRTLNSRLQGHPTTHEGLPGVRISSGSLGQGMSVSLGTAYAKKIDGDKNLVYSLHGDGELQEGQIWEAVLFAAHNKIDNYIATIDYNQKQIDGPLEEVLSMGDLEAKFKAFNWDVMHIRKGNDMQSVLDGLAEAKSRTGKGKPVCIIMHTEMGKGVDYMEGTHKWHGNAPNDEQLETALNQLEETFSDY